MDIKQFLSELFRFAHRFGVIQGLLLFFRLKIVSQKNIRVPGIRYPFSLRKGTSDSMKLLLIIVFFSWVKIQ